MSDAPEPLPPPSSERSGRHTSLEKALDICEALASSQRGSSVTDLARVLRQPAPTVHRLLAVLKRRGFVRQDEETLRYSLTLKMLDLSFRAARPIRTAAARVSGAAGIRAADRTARVHRGARCERGDVPVERRAGRSRHAHDARAGDAGALRDVRRRLGQAAFELPQARAAARRGRTPSGSPVRFGVRRRRSTIQRLLCTCAPVYDYTGRQVARVGVFAHAADEAPFVASITSAAMELARLDLAAPRASGRRVAWPSDNAGRPRSRPPTSVQEERADSGLYHL